jgi:hypothetical protein
MHLPGSFAHIVSGHEHSPSMRAADTIRDSTFADGPIDASKSSGDCQGGPPYHTALSIGHSGIKSNRPRILLLDPDVTHAEGLTHDLHNAAYIVTACADIRGVLKYLNDCDFEILVVSSIRAGDWKPSISLIAKATRTKREPPHVVVLARVYRGPQERLEAERKGVRLVYER